MRPRPVLDVEPRCRQRPAPRRRLLSATFERFDGEVFIGKDLASAIEFALMLGPAGEIMRLAGEEGARRRPEVVAALEDVLRPFARAEGVYGMSSSWIVTAEVP